jgi:hypothetical protein
VLDLPPVITAVAGRHYSPRCLSEDERVRLTDLHHEGRNVREIGALIGRSAATLNEPDSAEPS